MNPTGNNDAMANPEHAMSNTSAMNPFHANPVLGYGEAALSYGSTVESGTRKSLVQM